VYVIFTRAAFFELARCGTQTGPFWNYRTAPSGRSAFSVDTRFARFPLAGTFILDSTSPGHVALAGHATTAISDTTQPKHDNWEYVCVLIVGSQSPPPRVVSSQ
jgi:hypothetical protein